MNEDFPKNYDKTFHLKWYEPHRRTNGDVPHSKVALALTDELHINPDPKLFYYKINIPRHNQLLAQKYIQTLPSWRNGLIMIHYEGNSSANRKNISHDTIRPLVNYFTKKQYVVIILDWDFRSPLPHESDWVFCPDKGNDLWEKRGTGNAATIAALIKHCNLFVGVDSGPLHVAGSTNVPSIGIWRTLHPAHFYDFAENVTHLIPQDNKRYLRGNDRDETYRFFEKHYKHAYYTDLSTKLIETACSLLNLLPPDWEALSIEQKYEILFRNKIKRVAPTQWLSIGPKEFTVF